MTQKLKPALLSLFVLLTLQQALLAAPARSKVDKQVIATIDSITSLPDDKQESWLPQIKQIMEGVSILLAMNHSDFHAHMMLARCYEKLGMEDLAAAEDKEAEKGGDLYKQFVLNAVKQKLLENDFEAAIAYNSFAEKYFPDESSVLIAKALQLHKAGKLQEEEALLESISKRQKLDVGVLTALASIKARKNQYDGAVKLFDEDLKKDPQYQPALLGKAKTLEQMRCYGASLRIAIPLYQADPLQYELAALVANELCHLSRYQDAYQPGLVSLAVAMSQRQMDDAKRRIRLIWPRLTVAQRRKGLSEVSATFDQTVFGPRMHFALGDVLQKSGFVRDAELQFRIGLKLESNHASAYLHLAEIYQNNYHNNGAALLNYMKYLHFSGSDPKIVKRMQRLSEEKLRRADIALRIKKKVGSHLEQVRPYLPGN